MTEPKAVSLWELIEGAAGSLLPFEEEDVSVSGASLVRDIALYEPGKTADYQDRVVLVTSRVADRFALGQLLEEAGTAAALVLPPDATRNLTLLDGRHPVLLRRSPWAGWTEVFRMLARTIGAGSARERDFDLASLGDVAAWIARLTGASVTIEDLGSRLLAYSVVGEEVDVVRSQTILGGVVPQWRLERLMSSGFLPAVWRSDDVVIREAEGDDPARMVVAVRASEETMGTIWSTFGAETDRENLRTVLLEARAAAAPLFARQIHHDQHAQRMRDSALADLLRGKVGSGVPASMLGLEGEHRHAVIAVGPDGQGARTLAFHLQAAHPGSTAVPVDGDLMLIVPVRDASTTLSALADTLTTHLVRVVRTGGAPVAIGPIVESPSRLAESASVARQVLQAMALKRATGKDRTGPQVVTTEQVADALNLVRASDRLRPMFAELSEPLRTLELHDPELVSTLREVMRLPGNLAAAARELGIHSNSLRYRLVRIREVSGIDLHDPDSRLRTSLALLMRNTQAGEFNSESLPL